MGTANDNEGEATGPHEPALLAFAINVEFVKRLVLAQGADGFRPQVVAEIRTWMAMQIDGAEGYLAVNEEQEGITPELAHFAKQIAEARAWLDALT